MTSSIFHMADDNGYFNHKTAYFDRNGKLRTHKYRTLVGTPQEASNTQDGELVNMYELEDGSRYSSHESIRNPIEIRSNEYSASPENRVLVNRGLDEAGINNHKVHLTTSLPFQDYYLSDGRKNEDLIQSQIENMKQPVYRALADGRGDHPIANVVNSNVLCEGVAAMIDFIVDDDGNAVLGDDEIQAPMAVMDFGGATFDVVGISPEFNILQESSGTLRRGTYDMRETLSELLTSHLKEQGVPNPQPAPWMIDQALTTDQVTLFVKGKRTNYNVRELRRAAANNVVNEAKAFAKSKLKDLNNYQAILLVGGGALVCEDLFEDWSDQYGLVVRDEFANAKGMLKHATYLSA